MARYRQTDTRWIRGACVAGAYLVGVAVLFTLQVGEAIVVPVPFAVSAPPLVYAALSVVMLRQAPFVRRLSWVGGACLVHVVLAALASMELMWAGGLPAISALAQVFILFAPAPALTLVATPLVLTLFGLAPAPSPPRAESAPSRSESAPPRQPAVTRAARNTPFARGTRPRNGAAEPIVSPPPPAAPPFTRPSASPAARISAPAPVAASAVAPAPAPITVSAPPPAPAAPPVVPTPRREPLPVEVRKPARHGSSSASVDDVMVRVSFDRIAPQLPAEAFVLPFARLGESLKEPHALLVPRRIVLARMRQGGIAIDWATVASQFPELALGISEAEFRNRYPELKLWLPLDEVLSQLPPDTVPLVSAVVTDGLEAVPPPVSPPAPLRAAPETSPPVAATVLTAPVVAAAAPAVVTAPSPDVQPAEPVDRELVARVVACFGGIGTFEAAGERMAGTALITLVAPSLPRAAVMACAARIVRFLAAGPGEVVTVRTTRAVLVLAAATTPIVVAARRPGSPVALLELRAARAAVAVGDAPAPTAPAADRALKPLSVDDRVAGAGDALVSFGAVEATVLGDGAARVYVFSAHGRDATPLGVLALGVCEALGDGGAELGRLVSVVFHRGSERTLVRPLGSEGAVLAAAGPVTRPGRAHRDADRAAMVLEAL